MVFTIHAWAVAPGSPSKIIVSVNRYAVWAPYENDQGVNGSTFYAYALVLDSKGNPIPGENVEFKIYSADGLVSTQIATTAANGVAYVSYDVSNKITQDKDPDSGQWCVEAYPINYSSIIGSTTAWYSANKSCEALCHESGDDEKGGDPRSPYNDNFGQTKTRSEEAHTKKT